MSTFPFGSQAGRDAAEMPVQAPTTPVSRRAVQASLYSVFVRQSSVYRTSEMPGNHRVVRPGWRPALRDRTTHRLLQGLPIEPDATVDWRELREAGTGDQTESNNA
jgi:hypothetical protein